MTCKHCECVRGWLFCFREDYKEPVLIGIIECSERTWCYNYD